MDLKQGSEIKDEMNAEETMPMTDEERAYLEEHYRYIPQWCIMIYSKKRFLNKQLFTISIFSSYLQCSQDLDDYDYSKVKVPDEAILGANEDLLDASLDQEVVQFSCKFNLAPQESAKISLSMYLNVRLVI